MIKQKNSFKEMEQQLKNQIEMDFKNMNEMSKKLDVQEKAQDRIGKENNTLKK